MHTSLLAEIAGLRQSELLHQAETRRLRTRALARPSTGNTAAVHGLAHWPKRLLTLIRPAPQPCCV